MKTPSKLTVLTSVVFGLLATVIATAQEGRGTRAAPSLSAEQNAALTAQLNALVGNAAMGKDLWNAYYCYSCHGTAGHGGAGARLTPNPPSVAALIRYVRKPTGTMPPYTSKVLSDQQLADMQAYLKTIPPDPDLRNIPLLNEP